MAVRVTAFTRGLEFPFQLAGRRVACVQFAVIASEINNAPRQRRRRYHRTFGSKLPLDRWLLVDSVQILAILPTQTSPFNGARRNDAPVGLKFPFDAGELRNACGAVHASVFEVCSKHGGVLAECRHREEQEDEKSKMGSHELDLTWGYVTLVTLRACLRPR